MPEPYEVAYFKYERWSDDFNNNCYNEINICDMYSLSDDKVASRCSFYDGYYPIEKYIPYYKIALSENKKYFFLKKESNELKAIRLPSKNKCTMTQAEYKQMRARKEEAVRKSRIKAAEQEKNRILQEKQEQERQKAEEKKREALRKKQLSEAKNKLPASCRGVIHLKKKGTGGLLGSSDTTIGDFLAEKLVDRENVSIQCRKIQNQMDGAVYNAVGYAGDGEDCRGILFTERNGWALCRGIYVGNDIEENKPKCEASFTAFGSMVRTTQEELESF